MEKETTEIDQNKPEDSVMIESDSKDLRPSGSLTLDKNGIIRVGGWNVDENGFYSVPDGDPAVFEHRKDMYFRGGFLSTKDKAYRKELLENFRSAYHKLLEHGKK